MRITFPTDPVLVLTPDLRDRVHVNLRYESSDPYAVCIVIVHAGRVVTWLCARDLLMAGLARMVGEGDVRVVPGETSVAVRIVGEDSSGASSDGLLIFARDDLHQFLYTTYLAIPAGTETDHVNIDWDTLPWTEPAS